MDSTASFWGIPAVTHAVEALIEGFDVGLPESIGMSRKVRSELAVKQASKVRMLALSEELPELAVLERLYSSELQFEQMSLTRVHCDNCIQEGLKT